MDGRFTYTTKTQGDKEVILFDIKIHGSFIVEVNPTTGMADKRKTYKFNTLEEATKKFKEIKKRKSLYIL